MRRKYAPKADLLVRSAAAAKRRAGAARLAQRLVLPLITLPPVILVPGNKPILLVALAELCANKVERAQHLAITFTRHNRTQNLLTRLAHHVSDDVGQLDVHLRERLLLVAALVLMLLCFTSRE